MAHALRRYSLWLADSKVETLLCKGLMEEESFSVHGSQEAEKDEGTRDKNAPSQAMRTLMLLSPPVSAS